MKIQPARIDSFINNPDVNLVGTLVGALIYGPDSGLVNIRAKNLAEKILLISNNTSENSANILFADKIKEDPGILISEFSNLDFFSTGRKVIRVIEAKDFLSSTIEKLLESHKGADDPFLIIEADDLSPRSSLRKLAESSKKLASIPCYKDDTNSLKPIVIKKLREAEYGFDQDVPELIAANCLGNRQVLFKEIEKLFLYLGQEQKHITAQDIYNTIVESSESSMEQLCNAIASCNYRNFTIQLRRAYMQSQLPPVSILRYINNYFLKLLQLAAEMQNGKTSQEAIKSLKPPVFFKQVPIMEAQANFWTKNNNKKLQKALAILQQAELNCKKAAAANQNLICSAHLSAICIMR